MNKDANELFQQLFRGEEVAVEVYDMNGEVIMEDTVTFDDIKPGDEPRLDISGIVDGSWRLIESLQWESDKDAGVITNFDGLAITGGGARTTVRLPLEFNWLE